MYVGLHIKHPLFLTDFNESCTFLKDFEKKNIEIPNFMKIRRVRAELFHAEGRRDMAKLIVSFRNFANASIKFGYPWPVLFPAVLERRLQYRRFCRMIGEG